MYAPAVLQAMYRGRAFRQSGQKRWYSAGPVPIRDRVPPASGAVTVVSSLSLLTQRTARAEWLRCIGHAVGIVSSRAFQRGRHAAWVARAARIGRPHRFIRLGRSSGYGFQRFAALDNCIVRTDVTAARERRSCPFKLPGGFVRTAQPGRTVAIIRVGTHAAAHSGRAPGDNQERKLGAIHLAHLPQALDQRLESNKRQVIPPVSAEFRQTLAFATKHRIARRACRSAIGCEVLAVFSAG